MIQQINLYQVKTQSNLQIWLNPYLLSTLAVMLTLLLVSTFSLVSYYDNKAKHAELKAQLQSSETQLLEIQAKNPNQQIDAVLNQELQQTQSHFQNLSQILEMLADTHSDRSLGYSRYLSTLANQTNQHVWITHIQFNSEVNSIRLAGATFQPEQIPLLLERLQNTNVFKGRHFAKLSIEQNQDNPEQINFNVSSSVNEQKEVDHDRKP